MRCRSSLVIGVALVISSQFGLIGLRTASAQSLPFLDDSVLAKQLLPYAEMSQEVYGSAVDVPGWTRVGTWQQIFAAQGYSDLINPTASLGFYADVFKNAQGNITIAYRGTLLTSSPGTALATVFTER
jgi:hypothetical protein